MCPEQWDGVLQDGREIYARERHGYIRVDVGGETVFEDHDVTEMSTAWDAMNRLFDFSEAIEDEER